MVMCGELGLVLLKILHSKLKRPLSINLHIKYSSFPHSTFFPVLKSSLFFLSWSSVIRGEGKICLAIDKFKDKGLEFISLVMSEPSQQSCSAESEQEREKQPPKAKVTPAFLPSPNCPPPNSRIVINLSLTHYDVIEEVAEELGWKVQHSMKASSAWDVLWTDHHIQPDLLIRLNLFQKVSHFPGIHVLSRKNLLGLSLMDMFKRAPEYYNFFPKTWLLPAQYSELRKEFNGEEKTFIVKPEADCQGRGIFLTQRVEEVQTGQHYVVQEYIAKPLLIEGLKFDFRVYVLLCGISPMRIYIYEQGLARFATEPYIAPNKGNLRKQYIHLTNYAINKKNPKFVYNSSNQRMDVGHKRSLTSVFKLIEKRGHNLKEIKRELNDAIVKTLLLGHPLVAHQYRFCQPQDEMRNMCFHILGIDVMLDENCKPYVLEVNHTPSFVTDTPLDYHIKFSLIKDTLLLMNVNPESRMLAVERINKIQKEKMMKRQKRQLYENIDKQERVKAAQEERDAYEDKHLGKFTRIYPLKDSEQMAIYDELLEIAEKSYFNEANVLRAQMEKQKANEQANIKDDKLKRTINDESSSPLKSKKGGSITIDRGSQEFERSPDSPFRLVKRDRIGSYVESKNRGILELKEIQQELAPLKIKNEVKLSTITRQQGSQSKANNPKTLPRIIHDSPSSSPLRGQAQQNLYVAYRKKKLQVMKQRQQDKQREESIKDQKNLKEIFIVSKTKNLISHSPSQSDNEDD